MRAVADQSCDLQKRIKQIEQAMTAPSTSGGDDPPTTPGTH